MKKIVFLSLISAFLLSGCSGTSAMETTSCEYINTTDNMITNISYDIDHQNDEIKKVRITYDYQILNNPPSETDGVGTGTDGTTNDTQIDNDGIIDGIVGNTLDEIIGGISDMILDTAGIRERHNKVRTMYESIPGFSIGTTTDIDDNYKVTYVIDYDNITDDALNTFNLSRNLNDLKSNYINQGYTCR